MRNTLLSEIQSVQNPALGAILIWRFSCAYCLNNEKFSVPMPLIFFVLPLVYHSNFNKTVEATKQTSGLRKLRDNLGDNESIILSTQPRMMAMRTLSLRSIRIALQSGLISIDPKVASIYPLTDTAPPVDSKSVKRLIRSAEKLGTWCSEISVFESCNILGLKI